MFAIPDVEYTEGHGGLIAYETFGTGAVDLVHIAGWAQTVEGLWDLPMAERFYRRLASFARVVLVDRRGTGLSDPLVNVYAGGDFGPWLEEAVSDVITVLDTIGSEQVAGAGEPVWHNRRHLAGRDSSRSSGLARSRRPSGAASRNG